MVDNILLQNSCLQLYPLPFGSAKVARGTGRKNIGLGSAMAEENQLPPFEKERFGAFTALADFRMKRTLERTQRETRLSFALWAFFAAATVYLHPRPPEWLLVLILVGVFCLHVWFVMEVRVRNRLDLNTAFYYIEHAEKLLIPSARVPRSRPDDKASVPLKGREVVSLFTNDFWWSGLEIAITAGLAMSAYWIIGTTVKPG